MSNVPFIPDSAPFTPQQRAWLNGFFAGLYAQTGAAATPAVEKPALIPLTILYGSQTGNAEVLARKAASEAGRRGFTASVLDMAQCAPEKLAGEKNLLLIASTYGDGEPPDNARPLWDKLKNGSAPDLRAVQYSVLALGDSNYPKFCEFGKNFDTRLEELGGRRVHPRTDCDVDFEAPFERWLDGVLKALGNGSAPAAVSPAAPAPSVDSYSKKNPFPASMPVNRKLNAEGSAKDTRHLEILLEGSGLEYEAGDALGVVPANCPELVDELMKVLGFTDDGVRAALTNQYEITRISNQLLEAVSKDSNPLPGDYANGRDVLDLLRDHPKLKFESVRFLGLLRKLQPRLYSISSSPKAHPGQVHLTVAVVRYESLGRQRKGVCSTFLADRVGKETRVPVFVHPNKNFRPPSDPQRPMIMVGPGTGIAPFRAFLEERRATGAKGKNWLFFGDQHVATDFLYREEFEAMRSQGILTRLDTAFSRDQAHKIYVQDRIVENGRELFAWLEEGAHFYVCGDAKRMAGDVDKALHQLVQTAGGKSPEQAAEYVTKLKTEKRYQRDVY